MKYFKKIALKRKQYFDLFLLIVFPVHLWALAIIFQEGDWMAERTNVFDALGLFSYASFVALLESGLLFLGIFLLSMLMVSKWDAVQRQSLLGYIVLLIVLAAIGSQTFFILDKSVGTLAFRVIYHLNRLYKIMLPLFIAGIIGVVGGGFYIHFKVPALQKFMTNLIDRIKPLSFLYLFIDSVAILIIWVRNL